MLVDQLSDVEAILKGRGCLTLCPHLLVFPADEAHVEENFPEGCLQFLGDYLHRATKCADVCLLKAGWLLNLGELTSEVPDILLGSTLQHLSLERDLLRDLVLEHPSAVGRDHGAKDHDDGAIKTSKVTKEVEKGVGLPRVGHLAVSHPDLDSEERVLETATLMRSFVVTEVIVAILNCLR